MQKQSQKQIKQKARNKMNDLISRQDAIDACIRVREYRAYDEIEEIKALPSAQQWIPVTERLPKENGYYLTTTMHYAVYCDYWDGESFDRKEQVIAWMPLPEPWKGEQDEQIH